MCAANTEALEATRGAWPLRGGDGAAASREGCLAGTRDGLCVADSESLWLNRWTFIYHPQKSRW